MKTLIDYRKRREPKDSEITILVIETDNHCYYFDQDTITENVALFRDEFYVKSFSSLGSAIIWLQTKVGFSELIVKC